MKNLVKPGSPMLYFLTRGLNLLFGLSGAALIALTIWLSGRFNQYTYVNGVFLGLGILEVLLCGGIFLVRKSVTYLRLFAFLQMTLFAAQLVYVLLIYSVGPKIIKVINTLPEQDPNVMLQDLRTVTIYATVVLSIHLLQIIVMSLYCGSIRNRNYDFDFKFMEENKVIRNMVDQSVLQREKKEDKLNNAVRQNMTKNQKQQ